ncbi:Do family serine endopeptidase [Aestuariivirga sp.]|jgi:serine protease Do|uniref:Do family serine endopeptidase n=1 Tax=Aestuariivirga sp. TaxID=2650926 RepID=UPI003784FC4C
MATGRVICIATGAMAIGLALAPLQVAHAQTSPAMQLEQLPSVADLADRLLPAVVEITIEAKGPETAEGAPESAPGDEGGEPGAQDPDSPFKDFFDEFLKRNPGSEPPQRMSSMGSGFVIDPAGIIVTNNHVVDGADTIEVHFHDDTVLKGELVGRDSKTDLAVIRVKPEKPLAAVDFGDSDRLRVGEWVLAIGNPFGLGGSVSLGIVSARNRDINAGPYDDFIQTDAAINKGNSGGPLFNLKGEVMGINTAIFSPSGGSVGIGFSVPANTAKNVVSQLVEFGETRRGWLGVKIQAVTDDIAESLSLDRARGALVSDVTPTGPAAQAGVEPGDVILEFNGRAIDSMRDLPKIVAETPIGIDVPVKVLRKGKEVSVTAKVGRLEDGEKLAAAASGGSDGSASTAPAEVKVLGMTLATLSEDLRAKFATDKEVSGAVVIDVAADSAAAEKRLAPGDVITEAGEEAVQAAEDIARRADAARAAGKSSLLLLVSKGGKASEMRFIALKLKEQ